MRVLEAPGTRSTMTQRKCRLFLVDAFTRERFCGNPAAVVLDADVLEEHEMRRIAREIAGIEVAFVLGFGFARLRRRAALLFAAPRSRLRRSRDRGRALRACDGRRRAAGQGPPEIGGGIVDVEVRAARRPTARHDPPDTGNVRPDRAGGTPGPGARCAGHQLVQPAPGLPDAGDEQGELAPADRPAVARHARLAAAEDGRS